LNFLNLNYLFDEIGEEFNDLCDSFRNWSYNEEEITRLNSVYFLNNKSGLYKKLIPFNKKFAEKLDAIHYYSFTELIKSLMMYILKKGGNYIILPQPPLDNYYMILVNENQIKLMLIGINVLNEIIHTWKELEITNRSDSISYCYDRILIKDIDHFLSLINEKILEHWLRFLFSDGYVCLNTEYLCENLMFFDDSLNDIRRDMKNIKPHFIQCETRDLARAQSLREEPLESDLPLIKMQFLQRKYFAIFDRWFGNDEFVNWVYVFLSRSLKTSFEDYWYLYSYEKKYICCRNGIKNIY